MPLIKRYNFINQMREIIPIETYEGYSLKQLCLTLFYFDLFEFRSIEDFKTAYAEEYGVLLGKAMSPSIYTLRRFLHRVRELKRGEDLIENFARGYLNPDGCSGERSMSTHIFYHIMGCGQSRWDCMECKISF